MAVVNVKLEPSRATAPIDIDSGSSPNLSWTVVLDGRDPPETAAIVVRQAPGIPRRGDKHPGDPFAFCRRIVPESLGKGQILWRVTAEYYTPGGGGGAGDSTNPLDQPADVSWGFEQISQQVDTDLGGKPLVNSAGEPFDLAPEISFARPVLSISRNEARFDSALAAEFCGGRGAVNSGSFRGWAKGTVLVRNISAQSQRAGDFAYDRVTYELLFDSAGWNLQPLNVGYQQLVDGERQLIRDAQGQPLSRPAALNKDGTAKAPGAVVERLSFKMHPEKSFSRLRL
ncbi:MAG TPA: hypothetical protein VMW52_05025 [Phycisphaerae bacterium]|nr:hypothetical protein [Phycisphaerae bacterium]